MRDSFAMDTSRHSDHYKKSFVKFSCTGFFLFITIFLCCIVAVALLVYNFATCPQIDPLLSENHHFRLDLLKPGLSQTTSTESSDTTAKSSKDLRLPRSIKPVSYDVVLLPFLSSDNFTFNGEIAIRINVIEKCKNITLHSTSLVINWSFTHIQKIGDDEKPAGNVSITNQYFVDEKQFLVLETGKDLEANTNYVVKLQFVGSIKDNLQGFYKSSYNVGDETKWIASTQFQATDARR
jgi:aminopeptidase N